MKRSWLITVLLAVLLALLGVALHRWLQVEGPRTATPVAPLPAPGTTGALPGRATLTPAGPLILTVRPGPTLVVTSPFSFPTPPPDASLTPSRACTAVYPLDNIEAIEFGYTTIAQLEAAFGQAVYHGGRPPRFRFEHDGCILLVTVSIQEAQEAELIAYGTLGLLLDRYGPPAVAGIAQGNLTLPLAGSTVLLYPPQGIIVIFDESPGGLTRQTVISTLQFRAPYDLDRQITRLNVRPVAWIVPLR